MKTLYILPGWEDTGAEIGYKKFADAAKAKGYHVVTKPIDWTKPLSTQKFDAEDESVLFGFSLGAILAWLIAQERPTAHLILASMTPHYSFTDAEIRAALVELAGEPFVADVVRHLEKSHLAKRQTTLYGDREDEPADVLVPNTEHELTDAYITELTKLL